MSEAPMKKLKEILSYCLTEARQLLTFCKAKIEERKRREETLPPQPQQQPTSKSKGFKWNAVLLALVALLGIAILFLLMPHRDNVANSNEDQQTSNQLPAEQTSNQLPAEGTKAGERAVIIINGEDFAFRWCPPGAFMMGTPESEEGHWNWETQHQVTLTKGFWMMETEVTQKQWKAVMGTNPSGFKGDDLPVESVSWDDCQEFCRKCTELGLPVQLPTEAQWEYACRAGTTGAYAGNLYVMAWYYSNNGDITHPVGTKKANAWGLYDMHGNVWEWCADWYGEDYPSGSVTDPTGPSIGSARVIRGGGWYSDAWYCRSACRIYDGSDNQDLLPGYRCLYLGFRTLIGQ